MAAFWVLSFIGHLVMGATPAWAGDWGFHDNTALEAFQEGQAFLEAGKPNLAEKRFRAAGRMDTSSDLPSFGIGVALLNQNNPEEALGYLEKVAKTHARVDVYVMLAKCFYALEKSDEAMDVIHDALVVEPGSYQAVALSVYILLKRGDLDGAALAVKHARTHQPKGEWDCLDVLILVDRSDLPAARLALEKCEAGAIEEGPRKDARSRMAFVDPSYQGIQEKQSIKADELASVMKQTRELIDKGHPAEAIRVLDPAVQRYPDNRYIRFLRAISHMRLDAPVKARKDFKVVFREGDWIDVLDDGSMVGMLTQSDQVHARRQMGDAAIIYVLLEVGRGGPEAGAEALKEAANFLKDALELDVAASYLEFVDGEKSGDWSPILRHLKTRWPKKTAVVDLMQAAVAHDRDGAPESVFLWLDQLGFWHVRYNRASDWHNEKRYRECEAEMVKARPPQPEAVRRTQELAYACAVGAADLESAAGHLKRLGGVDKAPTDRVLQHARVLTEQKRWEEAHAILHALPGALPEPENSVDYTLSRHQLLVFSLVELGRLEEAMALADGSAPAAEYNLALQLYNSEREEEALPVLRRVCEEPVSHLVKPCQDVAELLNPAQ
jgi:tetratricopeptide (TPR) repeat protein